MIQSSGSPGPIATHLPTNPTSTMISLAGKVISVTGSASGMGLATAKALFARGASLSLADYRKDALTQTRKEIESSFTSTSSPKPNILATAVDIRESSQVDC